MRPASLMLVLVAAATNALAQPPKRQTAQPPKHETAQPKRENAAGRYSTKERAKKSTAPANFVELASATRAQAGTAFFVIGKEAGLFATLRLDRTKGKVVITRVRVIFDDGRMQLDDRRATLDDKRKSFVIDIAPAKAIDRIVVTTEPFSDGEYVIYGSPLPTVPPTTLAAR